VVFQFAEDGVAELLVEAEGLEVEGVKPDSGAVALAGNVFGLLHEAGSGAYCAEMFRDKEEFHEKPFVGGATP
jgi:hypothetical protein